MLVTVQRGDTTFDTEITPFYDEAEGKYRLGITVGATYDMERQRLGFLASVQNSWANCVYAGGAIFNALKDLVTTGAGLDQTAGPVGMISMVSDQVQQGGFDSYINLLVVISINLGIMNLLPIPPLDGGRFVIEIFQKIARRTVSLRALNALSLAGMALFLCFFVVMVNQDVQRFIFGNW